MGNNRKKIRFKHNRQQLKTIKQRWLRRSKEEPDAQGQILIQRKYAEKGFPTRFTSHAMKV